MSTTDPTENPSLDICAVLWKEEKDFLRFQDNLNKQTFKNFKVHVALNDGSNLEHLLPDDWRGYPGDNSGYAGGMQRIWGEGTAPWILFSNTDVTFENNCLERLMEAAVKLPDNVGALGPKVLYGDGLLQSVGGLLMGPEGLCKPRGLGEEDRGQYDSLLEVPVLSGCFFLIRREVLEDIGGFNPDYFMYVEDVDLFLRSLWAGWKHHSIPQIKVIHDHGGSLERYGSLHLYHLERNHWWLIPLLPISMILMKPYWLVVRWLRLAFKVNKSVSLPKHSMLIALKALFAGLVGIPRAFRKKSPRKIKPADFKKAFENHRVNMKTFLETH